MKFSAKIRKEGKENQGFTLIELLVVIAIIAMLTSIVLVSLARARSVARDAIRKSDAKNLRYALEAYYQDNAIYPSNSSPGTESYINDSFLVSSSGYSAYFSGSKIPNDPSCPSSGVCTKNYKYVTVSGQQQYGIYIQFETITPCKFMSTGGTATWFSSAPTCSY